MFVSETKRAAWNKDAAQITLQVASRGEENKKWAAATPSGQLTLTILNESAAKVLLDAFEAGQDVMVTMEPVDPA
jgi:hypothetical protein